MILTLYMDYLEMTECERKLRSPEGFYITHDVGGRAGTSLHLCVLKMLIHRIDWGKHEGDLDFGLVASKEFKVDLTVMQVARKPK